MTLMMSPTAIKCDQLLPGAKKEYTPVCVYSSRSAGMAFAIPFHAAVEHDGCQLFS
jgi:hypothetical protein